MQNRRWYAASWLSLCLFPPIFIHTAQIYFKRSAEHSLRFATIPLKSQSDFVFWNIPKPPETWYENVRITSNTNQNRKRLLYAATLLHEIRLKEDEGHGILFEYMSDASYGSFVETLDMLQVMRWNCYAADDNRIWVVYRPSRSELAEKSLIAPTLSSVLRNLPQPGGFKTIWTVIGEKTTTGWKKKWPAVLCFAILASFAKWYSCRIRSRSFKKHARTVLRSTDKDSEK